MSALPDLSKVIPLLSSPVDGEVLAAARAIDRKLKAAGCDWHDLSEAKSGPREVVRERVIVRETRGAREAALAARIALLEEHLQTEEELLAERRRTSVRWGWIGRQQRIAWCREIAGCQHLAAVDRAFANLLADQLHSQPHLQTGKADRERFNQLMKILEAMPGGRSAA